MHGYEMIREISDRSGGFWKPSPGSIYPTLQLLADENLIANVGGKSGKRLFELTDTGRATAAELGDIPPWEQVANHVDPDEVEFREAGGSLLSAMRQVSAVATPAQKAKASAVLNEARSSLYAILGELDSPSTSDSDKD